MRNRRQLQAREPGTRIYRRMDRITLTGRFPMLQKTLMAIATVGLVTATAPAFSAGAGMAKPIGDNYARTHQPAAAGIGRHKYEDIKITIGMARQGSATRTRGGGFF